MFLYRWPSKIAVELQPSVTSLLQLSLHEGCIFLGERVVIPSSLQKDIFAE